MLQNTRGVVLRTIKYGETSIVCTVYTEVFGIQAYLVNSVRTASAKTNKAGLYQPGTILDLVVYHSPNKNLQRIKEAKFAVLFHQLSTHPVRSAISLFIVELVYKAIIEPEANAALYELIEEFVIATNNNSEAENANHPIRFCIEFCKHLGFEIQPANTNQAVCFDLMQGRFCDKVELSSHLFAEGLHVYSFNQLVNGDAHVPLNGEIRKEVLDLCLQYLYLHVPHIQAIKSLDVLHQILSD